MNSHHDFRDSRGLLYCAAILILSTASISSAWAQQRIVSDPPLLDVKKGTAPRTTLMALPLGAPRMASEKQLDLNIEFTESKIYNPASGRYDSVRLRSYTGASVDAKAPHVAPTIEVYPGDTVRISLHNKLPLDPSCTAHQVDPTPDQVIDAVNTPHCFNGTNLHAHGLWVSPSGNSDNVLLSINPGVDFQYEYNIPPDHPAGTFWYHTHRHGSTALQVASGMVGALVVRGDRLPAADGHGDIDTLLKNADGRAFTERLLVLQQIQYACLDKGVLKSRKVGDKIVEWICDPNDVGGVDGYVDAANNSLFGSSSWGQSGRYTSINGQVLPTFVAKAGEVERWRVIHAGVHDTIALQFRKLKAGAPSVDRLTVEQTASYIDKNCTGEPLPFHLIASDGLTMANAQRTTLATLQPGYRNDALLVFPEQGAYCVINNSISAEASVTQASVSRRLMGLVGVQGGTPVSGNVDEFLKTQLVAAAKRTMPAPVQDKIVADLNNGLKLSSFTPHPDIEEDELKGPGQVLTFFIDTNYVDPATGKKKTKFEVSGTPYDPQRYDPKRIDRKLMLGTAEEWTLTSRLAGHPFHIHVNPFQVVKILDPNGKDVSAPGAIDDAGGTVDPEYAGLKGVWKDTLWVKSLISPPKIVYPNGIYTVVIRTRYERYIGDFVLHCHILDHEDQGMMQNVSVMLNDGTGGLSQGHH